MKTILCLLFLIPNLTFSQFVKKETLLEITILDTVILSDWMTTDTLKGDEDYNLNEKRYFIIWDYRKKYDTVIVYFDSSKVDTFMLSIYNGYKDNIFKEWYPDRSVKTIEDSKKNINKSWYRNGNLRWDKVPNSGISAFNYDVNLKNKSWFSDGRIRSDFVELDTNKIVFTIYYQNGQARYKRYCLITEKNEKGDGYSYPSIYKWPEVYKEEFFCENGQLRYCDEPYKLIKDYKSYHCNGRIKTWTQYYVPYYGPYGHFENYYPNGKIEVSGEFSAYDKNQVMPGIRIGKWIYYDTNGEIIRVEEF